MCGKIHQLIQKSWGKAIKDVQMLEEIEYVCDQIRGLRITFCKSGKDRTGMSMTLSNIRTIDHYFRGGTVTEEKILREVAVMRIYGVRLRLIEKNTGTKLFAINSLQAKFLPTLYVPPPETLSELLGKDQS